MDRKVSTEDIVFIAQCLVDREFSEKELAVLGVLCAAAKDAWSQRLREEVETDTFRGIFTLACAWTALAALEESRGNIEPLPLSFTAGALRVAEPADVPANARSLRRQAELLMTPYVEDGDFAFLEVRG